MDAFGTSEFRQEFCTRSFSLNIFQVLLWIMRSSIPSAVHICKICVAKFRNRKAGAAFKSMFGRAESGILRELGTEQECQVLTTALSNGIIRDFDACVADMFRNVFKSKELSLTYFIAGCYIQLHIGGQKRHVCQPSKCTNSVRDTPLLSSYRVYRAAEEKPAVQKVWTQLQRPCIRTTNQRCLLPSPFISWSKRESLFFVRAVFETGKAALRRTCIWYQRNAV